MKKVLLASTALLAFGAVSAQAAEPIKLTVGGSIVENFGYVQNNGLNKSSAPPSTKVVKFHEQDDGTLMFKGSTKLDNGLAVAVNWDLYGYAGSQSRSVNGACGKAQTAFTPAAGTNKCAGNVSIKRAYVTVSGNFGALILGEREDVTYIVHNSAPDVSPLSPIGDGYWYWWMVDPAQHRNLTADNTSRYTGRGNKITYVTPSFHGLALAFSYIPSVSLAAGSGSGIPATSSDNATWISNGQINGTDYGGDAYAGGLAYSDTLGGVAVKADATIVQANITNLRIWQQGLQVSYAGFTIGGSSMIRQVPDSATVNGAYTNASTISTLVANGVSAANAAGTTPAAFAQAAAYAGNLYTLGISYAIGPYAVSVAYFHDNSKSIKGLNGTGKADSTDVYDFGAAYTAGPGVIFRAGVGYVDYRGSNINSAQPWLNNNSGVIVLTGVKLDF